MAVYNKIARFDREQLINHYLIRNSISDYIYAIIRLIGIIIENIYCVSSYLVLSWIILLPINWVRNDLYSKVENYLYNALLFIVSSWSLAAGATVVETGDDYKHLIEEPDNYIAHEKKKVLLQESKKIQDSKNDSKSTLENGFHHQYNNFEDKLTQQSNARPGSQTLKETDIFNTNNAAKPTNVSINQSGDQISMKNTKNDLNHRTNDSHKDTLDCLKINHNNNNDDNNFAKKFITNYSDDTKSISRNKLHTMNDHQNINNTIQDTTSIIKKPRVLFLCNHLSTADVPLIMQSFSTLTNQSILWVLDAQFKPTNFGLVCNSHGDFFIAKDSFKDGSLRDQALKHPDRNLFVLFPEGGFWRKRLAGSNRYALKNNLPMTRYVTHPRFGAFKDLIDPSVEISHIVDATLLYDDIRNPLSILDIVLGTKKEPAILNYKIYNRSEINPTEEWLRNIWLEKDKLLQQYYEDRSSVYERFANTMRAAKLDWFKLLSVHLFYLLVCYLTIYRLFSATSATMLKARDLYYSNI